MDALEFHKHPDLEDWRNLEVRELTRWYLSAAVDRQSYLTKLEPSFLAFYTYANSISNNSENKRPSKRGRKNTNTTSKINVVLVRLELVNFSFHGSQTKFL